MSRLDENGVVHPTDDDAWDAQSQAHYAFCKVCNIYAMPDEMLREAKADAWDEGFLDGRRQDAEGEDGPRFTNPYRAEP